MNTPKEMKYFFDEDILYITLSKEKSLIGDEDYQENVVLYRHKNKVVGIEIHNFSKFNETLVKVSESKTLNLANSFKSIKMIISLRDIIIDDPEQFEETMKIWGFEKIDKKIDTKNKLRVGLNIEGKEISPLSLANDIN